MSDPANVSVRRTGHIGEVRLARPRALNAISGAMAEEIAAAFAAMSHDPEVWVVKLTAEGDKAFCVGADLKERAGFTLEDFHANRKQIRALFAAIRSCPRPTIAAVFGFALGGGFELALSCDLIVAAEGSEMGLPEARVGLLPAGGGTQLLTRAVGPATAKELIFTGRRMDASEAALLGLVARVVPAADLEDATDELARAILGSSPVALRRAKQAIDGALGSSLEDGLEAEHRAWESVIASEDRSEGIAAFAEKRTPRWSDR